MFQWLANTDIFAYPTNSVSRFYGAPHIGAKIQQLITDQTYDFGEELFDLSKEIDFVSDLGKTRGALAPHEFWYFWRRFFPNRNFYYVDEEAISKFDSAKFTSELAAFEAVFDKPVVLKGLIINWHIPYMATKLEKVLFIHMKRHPSYSAQSLIEARVKWSGDRRTWYSFKLREYDRLKHLDPCQQVAGQVYFTNRAIEECLMEVDDSQQLQIRYENFCLNPAKFYQEILDKLALHGLNIKNRVYTGPKQFEPTNNSRLSAEDFLKIIEAYKAFSGVKLSL